jgi:hypothetical protein
LMSAIIKDRIAFPISGDDPKAKEIVLKSLTRWDSIRWTLDPLRNRGDNNLDLLLTARTRRRRSFSRG